MRNLQKEQKHKMPKKHIKATIINYGEYKKWDRSSKALPSLIKICESVKGSINTEFGMIVEINGAKGIAIDYKVDHPPFLNEKGLIDPPYTGNYFINSNKYTFYLGDCIWEPIEDKTGNWTFTVFYNNKPIAQKTIVVTTPIEFDLDW